MGRSSYEGTESRLICTLMSTDRTETKNQHYVPQLLLRGFAVPGSDERAVAVLNLSRNRIIPTASIRGQCAKSFLYGKDGVVEKALAKLEGRAATAIREVIDSEQPPNPDEESSEVLTVFIATQYSRTPSAGRQLDRQSAAIEHAMRQSAKARGIPENEIRFDWSSLYYKKPEVAGVQLAYTSAHVIADLSYALVVNDTELEFALSDAGVVLHNHWTDGVRGAGGLAAWGVIFFLPISSRLLVLLYDSNVYRVRGNPGNAIHISNTSHIHELNRLQVIFSEENIYFSGVQTTGQALQELVISCTQHKRADSVRSDLFVRQGPSREDMFVLFSEKPAISMSLPWLPIQRHFREVPLQNRGGLRPEAVRAFETVRKDKESKRP